jgi:nucleoside-diphosphate-sugar epimerase
MKFLVSGASGYVGKRIVTQLLSRGHSIVSASRRPASGSTTWVPFDLDARTAFAIPDDVDLVVHLAANPVLTATGRQSELLAAHALLEATTSRGIRLIFASSQTAREDAPTEYGRTKWLIERQVLAANGIVVRLGQVYGGTENGLFGSMVSICKRLPVLPAFLPAPLIQPIHLDDCARAFVMLSEAGNLPARVYSLGASVPIRFTDFLRAISTVRLRQRRLFFPVPVVLIRFTLRMLGSRFGERTGLGRLNSLFGLHPMETASDLTDLGLELRPLSDGMHRSGSMRRRLVGKEARALLNYVLTHAPGPGLIRRYIRLIERLREGAPLGLSPMLIYHSIGIALIDRTAGHSPVAAELAWRLHAATLIAEACPSGAERYLGSGSPGFARSLLAIGRAVFLESILRIVQLGCYPVLTMLLKAKRP